MIEQTNTPTSLPSRTTLRESAPALRVALVTGIFPPDIGGPATHSADLREEFNARGHRVTVVTLWDGKHIDRRPGLIRFPRSWPWPFRLATVTAWLVANRNIYDIVYATGLHPSAVTGATLGRRPVVLKVVGDPAWERGSRLGLTGEGFDPFSREEKGGIHLLAMQALRDWSVRRATKVTVPSLSLQRVVAGWVGKDVDTFVIPNGIRMSSRPPRKSPAAVGPLRAIAVGRLVPIKQIDLMIRAIRLVRGVVLDIVGDGPDRAQLEDAVREAGLGDRVRFLGALEHAQVLRELSSADVLVTTSGYEGFPHVVVEAFACGTPVLGTLVGGLAEVLRDGSNGLALESLTPEDFAAGLSRLRDDSALRERLSMGALDTAKEYRFERMASEIETLLRDTLGKPLAVFVGKTRLPWPLSRDLDRKFRLMGEHLSPVVMTIGSVGVRKSGGGTFVFLPEIRPPLLCSVLFHALAVPGALALTAGRRRAVIVCQSPYEGASVLLLRLGLPRSLRPPVVVEVHGDWRLATRLYGSRARNLLSSAADRIAVWALRRADRVRVVSPSLKRLVRRTGFDGPLDSFPTFSDFKMFLGEPTQALPVEPSVVFVGILEHLKGVDVLREAWEEVSRRVPGALLTVAGAGTLAGGLRGGTIDLLGTVSRERIREILDSSWCLVLPSRSEGLPRVLLEAMARARPVVASSVGGIPELVDHGRTGVLIPPEDPKSLADALVTMLSDRENTEMMGVRARESVLRMNPANEYAQGVMRLASWVEGRERVSARPPRRWKRG